MNNELVNFKDYERKYERFFTDEKESKNKFDIGRVSAFNGIPGNTTIYLKMFRESVDKFYMDIFDDLVKIVWLRSRFCYDGKHRNTGTGNGYIMEEAYGWFMKKYVGVNNRTIFYSNRYSFPNIIISYFPDFFPNFEEGNPFEEKYEYPYKYMNLDCLLSVVEMSERMNLLEHGEKDKMSYLEFTDYVINYINCYNEEHDDKYEYVYLQNQYNRIIHMKKGEKYEKKLRGHKCKQTSHVCSGKI